MALELARLCKQGGVTVYSAESLPFDLLKWSTSIRKSFRLPSPRYNLADFQRALIRIIEENEIDFLLPTCEEIYWIAKIKHSLPIRCRVLIDTFAKLESLHNKSSFLKLVKQAGLSAPRSVIIKDQKTLTKVLNTMRKAVLKPVYSRFSAKVLFLNYRDSEHVPTISFKLPWLFQEYIEGKRLSVYCLCLKGKVLAFTAYYTDYSWGVSTAVYFKHVNHPTAQSWTEQFAAKHGLSGQFGFDFIESSDNNIWPLECNPRPTSGVHMFHNNQQFAALLINKKPTTKRVAPAPKPSMVTAIMLMQPLKSISIKRWPSDLLKGRDIFVSLRDPLPVIAQFLLLGYFYLKGKRHGISTTEAVSMDNEYNGSEVWR